MPEPAFDTLEAARGLKSAGIDSEHAEAIVEVMGQPVNRLVTREHFDLTVNRLDGKIAKLGTELHACIDSVRTELHARIDGVETRMQSLEATLRAEIVRAGVLVVGILIPASGLLVAVFEFYSSRGGGA